jgi:hypothetical protein
VPCHMLPSAIPEPALDAPHVRAWRKGERDPAAHALARTLGHTPLKTRGSMFQGTGGSASHLQWFPTRPTCAEIQVLGTEHCPRR